MELKSAFQLLATDDRFIQDTREIIVNDLFHQQTNEFFTIVPGVKGGQQVAAMKGFEYVTTKSAGCGGAGISPSFPAFSQFWNPTLQEVKLNYCYSDFMGQFTQWALANGHDIKDLGQTELAMFIQDLVIKAMELDLQRIILLGDKDIATQDILTDEATFTKYYDTIDKGLIPTLQYLATLPEFSDQFVDLAQNDANTIALQNTFAADDALKIYEEILDQYDFDSDILLTSNRLFKNYKSWVKRANGWGLESNKELTMKGVGDLEIDGQTLKPIVNYDRWKQKDFVVNNDPDPDTIHIPHFALNTRKEFLQVGVDSEAALTDLRLEYIGGDDETFWIKGNYMLDFKMVNPYAMKGAL